MSESRADAVEVRGEADGISTLSVYYVTGGQAFRMRLRPNSTLPEDDHVDRGEALTVTDYARVEDMSVGASVVEWLDVHRVPPVVRQAVQRPVQIPGA